MADEPVRTRVRTAEGWLDFQDYFVRLHQDPEVREVRFDGAAAASASPEVFAALSGADAIVIAPSNPVVSIGPILAVPGIRAALARARQRGVPVVAVSPIVGGRALKGPADRMLRSLGSEASALGVARRYVRAGRRLRHRRRGPATWPRPSPRSASRVLVTDTMMADDAARAQLARATLDLALSR